MITITRKILDYSYTELLRWIHIVPEKIFSSWPPFIFRKDSFFPQIIVGEGAAFSSWWEWWKVSQVYASEKQKLQAGSQSDSYGVTPIMHQTHCHG